jgi:hypothetical protein
MLEFTIACYPPIYRGSGFFTVENILKTEFVTFPHQNASWKRVQLKMNLDQEADPETS